MHNELNSIQDQKNRAVRLYTLGNNGVTESDVATIIEELNLRQNQFSHEFSELLQEKDSIYVSDESIQQISDITEQISIGIDHFTNEEKLSIIDLLGVNCILHKGETKKDDTLEIIGFFPATIASVGSTEFEFKPSTNLNPMVL